MLSYQIKECQDCESIVDIICLVEAQISVLTTLLYNQQVYLSHRVVDKRRLKDLIYYKEILLHLLFNREFYSGYSSKKIISKIKTLA